MRAIAILVTMLWIAGCTPLKTDDAPSTDAAAESDVGDAGDGAQRWVGYVESYTFASGSDRIALLLIPNRDGTAFGTVSFGAQRDVPPAMDPAIGYPPDGLTQNTQFGRPIEEGFAYPIARATLSAARMQLSVDPASLWATWCKLQTTTYPWWEDAGVTTYACVPSGYPGDAGADGLCTLDRQGPPITVDCRKFSLCQVPSACDCTATGCVAAGGFAPYAFDMALTGDVLDGTLLGVDPAGGMLRVHLSRSP